MPESKPQILFLAHRVPYPPNRGDRIRSYHLIRFLAEQADVHLAFLSDDDVPEETQLALEKVCKRVTHARLHRFGRFIKGAFSVAIGASATEGLFGCTKLRKRLLAWGSQTQFDAIFVFCSSMVQYVDDANAPDAVVVVDLVDVDSQKWFDYAGKSWGPKRWLLRLEGHRLRQLEARLPDLSEAITVVTSQEADLFQSFCPGYRPRVLRNGVDLEYFRPEAGKGVKDGKVARNPLPLRPEGCSAQKIPDPDFLADQQLSTVQCPLSAVFVGALDYRANVDGAAWFCAQVWPEVIKRYPEARFRLVGSRPSPKALRLGEIPGVEMVGEVPDVRPYLREATVVVVPLQVARGIQNKVLEALASGKPVVISPQGLEGIEAEPERDLIKATTPSQWVAAITRLFDSPAQCEALGRSGREFVEQHYRWSTQLEQLGEIPGLTDARKASQSRSRREIPHHAHAE